MTWVRGWSPSVHPWARLKERVKLTAIDGASYVRFVDLDVCECASMQTTQRKTFQVLTEVAANGTGGRWPGKIEAGIRNGQSLLAMRTLLVPGHHSQPSLAHLVSESFSLGTLV